MRVIDITPKEAQLLLNLDGSRPLPFANTLFNQTTYIDFIVLSKASYQFEPAIAALNSPGIYRGMVPRHRYPAWSPKEAGIAHK